MKANMTNGILLRLNLDNMTTSMVSKKLQVLKYGCFSPVATFLMSTLKYKIHEFFMQQAKIPEDKRKKYDAAIGMSNYVGPKKLMPISKTNYVSSYFGGAVGAGLPILFTFVGYENKCKIGLSVDQTFIKNPQQLKDCWFSEWEKCYAQHA